MVYGLSCLIPRVYGRETINEKRETINLELGTLLRETMINFITGIESRKNDCLIFQIKPNPVFPFSIAES